MGLFLDAIFPPRCPVCDDILYESNRIGRPMVCKACVSKIKRIQMPACMKCGKQLDVDEQELCRDCQRVKHEFIRCVAAFSYSDSMKQSMYAFKYNNRREYAGFYADSICDMWANTIKSWAPEVMVPVPLHSSKLRKRGYNQASVLAHKLSQKLGIPVDDKYLLRTRKTTPLKELSDKERALNLKNAFQVKRNSVKYKKIVLVDDIYTTGNTLDECARAIKIATDADIHCITVCIGRGF